MNKKIALMLFAGAVGISSQLWAGDDLAIIQAASERHVQVANIKGLPDATAVTLTGTLVKHLNQEHYEFNDGTGLILLEIDDDLWKAAGIQAGEKVRVVGEVDTHRYKPTDVEVVKIEKLAE
ncbi:NirD/YgiW/YdeI family stress tolerance protein [Acinetobacter sp. ANC 3813]|uniref:NirD/YgiW/YdeI family stress tolerance protein n=1 Tax=Acinetobacter sp. ANC 3813 TaxID=1977873 RepID=UPI000B668C0F|nr:NirD/YgiW/YdeI family stress tolerance protein [Acinetobacter sp. ANC 3813]OTG88620.1 DNA-binding protein [Acinetobacter sp. ANC 3813]